MTKEALTEVEHMKRANSEEVPSGTLLIFDLRIFYIAVKITNDCWMYILNGKLRVVKELYDNIDDHYTFIIDENEGTTTGQFLSK